MNNFPNTSDMQSDAPAPPFGGSYVPDYIYGISGPSLLIESTHPLYDNCPITCNVHSCGCARSLGSTAQCLQGLHYSASYYMVFNKIQVSRQSHNVVSSYCNEINISVNLMISVQLITNKMSSQIHVHANNYSPQL